MSKCSKAEYLGLNTVSNIIKILTVIRLNVYFVKYPWKQFNLYLHNTQNIKNCLKEFEQK